MKMKIKKYVLFDNKIIMKNRWGLWLRDSDNMIIDGVGKPCEIGVMHKTSDNILDLVEVGDLVEIDNDWEILKVLMFNKYNEMVCMVRTSSTTENYIFASYRKQWIKAIYKLQPNGDYKRYEREESELND